MKTITPIVALLLTMNASMPAAQMPDGAVIWRTFAEKLEVGARINVRLDDGRRINATFVQATPDALLIQPRARVPVPVQSVPYGAIASIERDAPGMNAGKAALIGVAAGVATFFGIFLILVTALD
jgi:hypothetical protein